MFGFFKKKEDNKPAYSPVENNTGENTTKDFSDKAQETLNDIKDNVSNNETVENISDKAQETFNNTKEELSDFKDNILNNNDQEESNSDNVPSSYSPQEEDNTDTEELNDSNDLDSLNEEENVENLVEESQKQDQEPFESSQEPETDDNEKDPDDNDLEILEENEETYSLEPEDSNSDNIDNVEIQQSEHTEIVPVEDESIENTNNDSDEGEESLTDFDSSNIFDNEENINEEDNITDFDPESDLDDFFNDNSEEQEETNDKELPVVEEYTTDELEESYEEPTTNQDVELEELGLNDNNEIIETPKDDTIEPIVEDSNIVETEEKEDIIDDDIPLSFESNSVLVENVEPHDTETSTEESVPEINEQVVENEEKIEYPQDENDIQNESEDSFVENENTPINYTINEEALNSNSNNSDKSSPIIVMNGEPEDIKNGISSYIEDYPVYLVDITENGSGYSYIPENANKSYIEINEDDKYSPLDTFNIIKDKTNETGRSFIVFAGADRAADKLVEGFADSPVGLNVISQQVKSLVDEAYDNNITIIITGEKVNDNFSKLLNKIFYQ